MAEPKSAVVRNFDMGFLLLRCETVNSPNCGEFLTANPEASGRRERFPGMPTSRIGSLHPSGLRSRRPGRAPVSARDGALSYIAQKARREAVPGGTFKPGCGSCLAH